MTRRFIVFVGCCNCSTSQIEARIASVKNDLASFWYPTDRVAYVCDYGRSTIEVDEIKETNPYPTASSSGGVGASSIPFDWRYWL